MEKCSDKKCPIHGNIKIRGMELEGNVKSARAKNTVTVERVVLQRIPKYERYKKSTSRVHAHNPECIQAKEGDLVKIGETRKLSKTKSFVVTEIIGGKK